MKKILDVGNCSPDHSTLTRFMTQHFDCKVEQAHDGKQAMDLLRKEPYDLVLVNRKLDKDYSDGMEIIKQMKADSATSEVPVMLITNYPDHQEAAEAIGARRGFGKLEYNAPATLERVKAVLG